ncbi:unnamed protein product [Cuscuta campestris]|uniref:Uncharacterized protein n=1 Tax=Cuscuta campestris TaxID=132261 RepID=A0A484K961_9ASTE|nr:unnamed protein product [Cuscuta campestris]
MVMEGIQEDMMGDGSSMQCTNHPYKNSSSPGGICALCLQEKLGKLVSSSFPAAIFPSSSSSSTPSFRSDLGGSVMTAGAPGSSLPLRKAGDCGYNHHHTQFASIRKPRMPFQRRKKKSSGEAPAIVFKRSKSTAAPRNKMGSLDTDRNGEDYSPRKRGFWSFLYYPSSTSKKVEKAGVKDAGFSSPSAAVGGPVVVRDKKRDSFVVVEENEESPEQATAAHDRKVSRSRSVGCGSRSFSGDFFERISTGFGDCTLRRVESQREGKPKIQTVHHRNSVASSGQECIRERVKCGGIFSGFMMITSSSSSDWVSSEGSVNGKSTVPSSASMDHHHNHHHHHHQLAHGRIKNWGWALASPMRAFTKPSTAKTQTSNKNASPNLASIPSLLTVKN